MWTGKVESIYIASAAQAPTQVVEQVQAIPGVGLVGDRYALKQGGDRGREAGVSGGVVHGTGATEYRDARCAAESSGGERVSDWGCASAGDPVVRAL